VIGNDKATYLKMVSIWSITDIPDLKSSLIGNTFKFTWAKGWLTDLDAKLFYDLEPIEIVEILEKSLELGFKESGKNYRKKFKGFTKNPFSSQN
jgi:hypothetical protein|tara:strand:- start:244 stop:525 length:282 start_codon:yes stop_codon:yes gene_type:complete